MAVIVIVFCLAHLITITRETSVMNSIFNSIFGYESEGKIPFKHAVGSALALVVVFVFRHQVWAVVTLPFRIFIWFANLPGWITWIALVGWICMTEYMHTLSHRHNWQAWRQWTDNAYAMIGRASGIALLAWMLGAYAFDNTVGGLLAFVAFYLAAFWYAETRGWIKFPPGMQVPDGFEGYSGLLSLIFKPNAGDQPPQSE
jgi:hypothetical protein